mmetsp:Transcript_24882/g.78923  ORF Transcript_24882/g.78923 Transcript_24882/m.78923 type:complete len:253 (-) Transcript_24882:72-830(-)
MPPSKSSRARSERLQRSTRSSAARSAAQAPRRRRSNRAAAAATAEEAEAGATRTPMGTVCPTTLMRSLTSPSLPRDTAVRGMAGLATRALPRAGAAPAGPVAAPAGLVHAALAAGPAARFRSDLLMTRPAAPASPTTSPAGAALAAPPSPAMCTAMRYSNTSRTATWAASSALRPIRPRRTRPASRPRSGLTTSCPSTTGRASGTRRRRVTLAPRRLHRASLGAHEPGLVGMRQVKDVSSHTPLKICTILFP